MSNSSAKKDASANTVIGIGSNIEPQHNILMALRQLRDLGTLEAVSTIYSSAPVGRVDQPAFLNGAALVSTKLSPAELKTALRRIESDLGRVRDPNDKNGPRTIDLDLTLYDTRVDEAAKIPDPDLLTRWFLAIPAAELWPNWQHPATGERLDVIAERLRGDIDGQPVTLST